MGIRTPKTRIRIFSSESVFTVLFALVTIFACEFEEPIPTYTLTTSVSPNEGGKITRSPELPNYKAGDVVTLTPEPNEHWVFKQWDGDATGNTTPLQISMNSNKSITGVFVKRDYPLNIKIEGQGTVEEKIIPNPSGREYPHGTRVELKPIPKEGWVFESWGGDLSGNETPQIITVDKEKNVIVKFKRRDYPLNITITGEGTVEEKIVSVPGGKTYPFETVVELKPVPKLGWVFESWGGDLTGTEATKNITVDKEKNVTVKFKRKDYPLNVTISGEGTVEEKIVSSPGGRSYPYQTVVELAPKPKEGWVFEGWAGDLTGNEAPKNITVDKEKNVTAKFKRRDYPLNLILEGEGLVEEKIVSSPGDRTYPFQTVVELTPKPKDGWVFESWGGDLTGNEVPKTITVDKEKNVKAKFIRKEFKINYTFSGEGTVEEKIISIPGNRTYPFQTVVELTPKPKDGWEFESWGGDLTGNEAPKNITVDKEKNVTAKFVIIDPLKNFFGYKVASNAKQLGGRYWESLPVPMDLMVYKFQAPPIGRTHNGNSGNVVAGDFNLDGWVDIFSPGMVYAGNVNVTTSFLIWNPSKKIFEDKNYLNNNSVNLAELNAVRVVPSYLNGDDYVDVVIFGFSDEGIINSKRYPVTLMLSDGKGGFDLKEITTEIPISQHEGGDVGDLNGDKIPDLVVNSGALMKILWGSSSSPFFNDSNSATFVGAIHSPYQNDNGFGETCIECVFDYIGNSKIVDINNDGKNDLVLNGNDINSPNRILINLGNGRFNKSSIIYLPNSVTPGIFTVNKDYIFDDLNSDGKLDIIALNVNSNYSWWNYLPYIQQNDGSFIIDKSYVVPNFTKTSTSFISRERLIHTDMNGDGKKDIIYLEMNDMNQLKDKTALIRTGNRFIEQPFYQFDVYARNLIK